MKHEDILCQMSEELSYSVEEIDTIVEKYYAIVTDAIVSGAEVELGTVGRVVTRMREGAPAEGSPRTPKHPYRVVVLKASGMLKKRLNVAEV